MYKTVACFLDPLEAHLVCGRLRAEGFDAHVADDQVAIGNWSWRLAIGGAKVRVAPLEFEDARAVLEQVDRGAFALDDETATATPDRETWSSRVAYVAGFWFGIPTRWRRR